MIANVSFLRSAKNLLALSCGGDSIALFYHLIYQDIDFEIAIVNYNIRQSAALEIQYAKELALKFDKKIHILDCKDFKDGFTPNFELKARQIRYEFFFQLISEFGFQNLLLAHTLNDRLEWLLMQLFKGSGLNNLLGFSKITKDGNLNIIRPFCDVSKEQIKDFLKRNKLHFFEDQSNADQRFLRNKIRLNFANDMIKHYRSGIAQSFYLLENEQKALYSDFRVQKFLLDPIFSSDFFNNWEIFIKQACSLSNAVVLSGFGLFCFKKSDLDLSNVNIIDKLAKRLKYVISSAQRREILKSDYNLKIGKNIIIAKGEFLECTLIFVASDLGRKDIFANKKEHKKTRDLLRKLRVPILLRDALEKAFFKLS
ncbi:MAG: tRNA lysidine(34) synthetase TilS [Helicobacter sp.]|nr:tRNA lysidine(34) synthetase TilS [Helicobacter sp.]